MAEQVTRRLSEAEREAALAKCPNKGKGCLADIPRELAEAMHGVGDKLFAESNMRFIGAAAAAGAEGRSLGDAVYLEAALVEHLPTLDNGFTTIEIGDGERTTVAAETETYTYLKPMAECAFMCGKSPDCVLKGES